MNILCINICQRPDWVIVLWTKIAPENNSIWLFVSEESKQLFNLDALLMTAPTTSSAKESQPSMSWEIRPCCGDYSILKYPLPSLFLYPHPSSSMVLLQSIPSPSPSPGQEGVFQQINPTVAFHELVFTTSCSKRQESLAILNRKNRRM